jgi:hypothetical protein
VRSEKSSKKGLFFFRRHCPFLLLRRPPTPGPPRTAFLSLARADFARAPQHTMAADGQGFAISLGLNLLFLAVIYFLFAVLRDAAPTKKFYAPRRYMRGGGPGAGASSNLSSPAPSALRPGERAGGAAHRAGANRNAASQTSTGYKRPKRLPTGWFAWIGVVHRTTQEDVIGVAGMDAAVYLAFLKLCE